MRFGLFIPQGWRLDLVSIPDDEHWPTMRRLAQAAEEGPWDSLWVYDHFHTIPVPTDEATHEAWTLMAAFAATTSRIRLGQMCTSIGYRNPVHLAKIAATVDHVSVGRLEVGVGAGWYEPEYLAYGYPFPAAPDRLRMLDECASILRQAWVTGHVNHTGSHFAVEDARVLPRPIQSPGIPLWIAGGGEKVTLRIAAQFADYSNFNGGAEEFAHKSAILRTHAERLGRDDAEITRSSNFTTILGTDDADVRARVAAMEARIASIVGPKRAAEFVNEFRRPDSPEGFAGTPAQLVDMLSTRRELGLGYAIHYFPDSAYDRSGVELYEREVIPQLS